MSKKTLLAIDDDDLILRLLVNLGNDAGYDVIAVQDAQFLSDTLDRLSPELIILDLVMPKLDGIEVLRMLADKSVSAALLIISGYDVKLLAQASALAKTWGLNIVGSVEKPLDAEKLALALKQIEVLD